jgi:hypothetical protein
VSEDQADEGALFGVDELREAKRAGPAEAGLHKALVRAVADGIVTDLDAAAVGAALLGARALDRADFLPDKSAVYAIFQGLTPYRELLHALRLPAAIAPGGVPLPTGDGDASGVPSWLSDEFGTPS